MRVLRGLLLLPALVLPVVLTPIAPSFASDPSSWDVRFDQVIYGDFTLVGNAVMTCPGPPQAGVAPSHPPQACADAQHHKGAGLGALNNSHSMTWIDIDKDEDTFNSSSARMTMPSGAEVAYAQLGWAGDVGRKEGVPCGRGKSTPPGAPERQAVSLTVDGGGTTRIDPNRFTLVVDDLAVLGSNDQQYYSAQADVTGEFKGVHGDTTVTVGNIWTPQGYDCFGGWSLTVVWKFTGPTAQHAPAKKSIVVYGGHIRVPTGKSRLQVTAPSIRAAGGSARIGLTAYEGDWATAGDQFLVNGVAQGDRKNSAGANNFFASYAEGRQSPDALNNMSVDVRTLTVSDEIIRPGATSAEVTFTRRDDAYLVQNMAVAFPLPELTVTTRPDRPFAHPGDLVAQTVAVTNAGGAPARQVTARVGEEPPCVRNIGALAAGATVTVTCDVTAEDDDYRSTAKVTGQSLVGDTLATEAATAVEVLRPSVRISHSVEPASVLDGQPVQFQTVVHNTGDTPLSGLALRNTRVGECDRADLAALGPGQATTVNCAVIAGGEGLTNTAIVSARDKLDRQVSAAADAAFDVVHPLLSITAVWSTERAARDELVTITVTTGNPSKVPFQQVQVAGEPASCRRSLGTLAPGQRVEYTCEITMDSDVDTQLSIAGVPVINGSPVTDARAISQASGFTDVHIAMLPVTAASSPPTEQVLAPSPPYPAKISHPSPISKPAAGALAAVPAMASMVVVVSATSGIGKS
jgi:hypothetical protein